MKWHRTRWLVCLPLLSSLAPSSPEEDFFWHQHTRVQRIVPEIESGTYSVVMCDHANHYSNNSSSKLTYNTHKDTTILRPFFPDYLGEPVPEEKLLDFMVQGKINRGRHTDHPAGCHFIRTNQCPPPPSPIFYRPDALSVAQPTVSKH